jgi:hypothetical protein
MSNEGFMIMDSDLHLMEPQDLCERYSAEFYRESRPRLFGERQKILFAERDKSQADKIPSMETSSQKARCLTA